MYLNTLSLSNIVNYHPLMLVQCRILFMQSLVNVGAFSGLEFQQIQSFFGKTGFKVYLGLVSAKRNRQSKNIIKGQNITNIMLKSRFLIQGKDLVYFQIFVQSQLVVCTLQQFIIMNRQRPYRPQRSPTKESMQIQDYRLKQALRSDLSMLQEENAILKLKCKKVSQLQDKVEMVLKQNSQLLSQNQKLSRFLHQQKSENEILRNKCETLANQKVGIMGEFEQQRKKMIRELELLGDRLSEEQALKSAQVNDIRSQLQVELQNIKRQYQNSQNSYELEIRKLRQQLDKREHQLSDYASKMKRMATETDYQIIKLKEQRQKLRNELAYCEADRIKQLDSLKTKFEINYHEEIDAIKRVHLNNLEEVQIENARLKETLDERCRQLDALVNKSNKQRAYYEDSITYLKRDCQAFREKIIQTEQLGHLQLAEQREKLHTYHQAEVDELREKHLFQIKALQDEIARLENINHGKNIEIQQLIKDKVATRGIFDSQQMRVKDEYSAILQKYKDLQMRHADLSNQANNRLNDREKHIQYLQDVNKTQKSNHQSQSLALHKIIQSLKQELSNEKIIFRQNEQHLKEEISKLNHELDEAKTKAELQKAEATRVIQDLKNDLNGTSFNLTTRADKLNSKNLMIEKENEGLKNNIIMKEKEIKNLVERLKASSEREQKLSAQIDQIRTKMVKRQQKSNDAISQQKSRLEASFNYTLQNLRNDHQAMMRLQANRYRDLQEKLKRKQAELEQLLRMYKKMTDEIQILTEQQANKKDITLKFPGATADLIATKNLFDIYLKTKVLDVCGSAIKQNKP